MEHPDWQDSGSKVKVTLNNGLTITGEVDITDWFFDGEEEVPFPVINSNGKFYKPYKDFSDWEDVELVDDLKEGLIKSLHQGCANLHVSNHNHPNPNYIPMCTKWLQWIIKPS